jgi:hypothetical protein
MRLRSSQLVFLLLLACSAQVREEHVLRGTVDSISGRTLAAAQPREIASPAIKQHRRLSLLLAQAETPLRLDSASRAFHRTPRAMRRPALDSASIASHTSLLRA